jgi:hypothetical protein
VSRPAPIRPLPRAALLAALGLAVAAPGAAAQDPAAIVDGAIPHDSAISEQYQRVQEVLDQAAAAVPDTPIAQPAVDPEPVEAPATPAPEPAPSKEQYHSENVSVTQTQPSNVNVSIRINSPGDDGPVVQINNAGGSSVVEQVQPVVHSPAAQPEPPAEPAGGDLPSSWNWTWTSACFGGAPRAGAASATPGSGWNWNWSCDEQAEGDDDVMPGLPGMPDVHVPRADDLIAAVAPTLASVTPSLAAAERPRARPEPRARTGPSTDDTRAVAPLFGAGRAPPAPPLVAGASAHAPPVAAAHRPRPGERAPAEARPGPAGGGSSSTLPPGSGLGLGAGTALSSVAMILLGLWTAVLVTACVIVLPRIRRRRWTGPAWRLTRLPSARLERPG